MKVIITCFAWSFINYVLQIIVGWVNISSVTMISFIKYLAYSNWFLWAVFYCSVAMLICVTAKYFKYIMAAIFIILGLMTPDFFNSIGYKRMFSFFVVE